MPTLRRRRGPLLLTAFTAVIVTALSGCTVPPAGLAGVTVAADGSPVGVIVMCHDHIDGATLHPDDGDATGTPESEGYWRHDTPVTGFTSWSLTSPADGWTAERAPGRLVPGQRYGLYGWTEDSSWAAAHVYFTTADLEALAPGQVRYERGDDVRTVSTDEFREKACEDF
ncbi:hypothetical protein ABZY16_07315 [Streptomyces sp. NPDC006553]|uniref:hypothetical protein n=1 Tax=unclassified Streptomyces TaxID=2593676 RepID=UPI0022538D4E|nr:hypothetical protein [Streptomyces sp. NBC_00233]MCX5227686.1 hypothetical protein [Streptomyces sp. NBC_00233]